MQKPRWRVLVVDDNAGDRVCTRHLLADGKRRFKVDQAASAWEALSMLDNTDYDCILLDYSYPGSRSLEQFDDYLTRPSGSRVPVVVQTAENDAQTAITAMKCGVEDYVPKTRVDTNLLAQTIDSAILKADAARRLNLSLMDEVTRIPNRRCFTDRLDQAVRSASRSTSVLAVMVMDLDGLNEINDRLGPAAGSRVLRNVANRMSALIRESDTIARSGANEFAALFPTVGSVEGAAIIARKISDIVAEPMSIEGTQESVGVSTGVTVFPDHGDNSDDLLARAHAAMLNAKLDGERFRLFERSCDVATITPAEVVGGVQRGIGNQEFVLEYQPQIDLRTGAVDCLEALIRWQHPEHGRLEPDQFIPGLERTNSITDLTVHVAHTVAMQMSAWRAGGDQYRVAINLSACLLEQESFPRLLLSVFESHDVSPTQITLEITESAMMRSPKTAARTLRALADIGFRISIDDFGAGYTSFSHLSDIEVHEIKIDPQFVRADASGKRTAVVKGMIELSKALNLRVVAEGIESVNLFGAMRNLGCDVGQGYAVCYPLKPENVSIWMQSLCTRPPGIIAAGDSHAVTFA